TEVIATTRDRCFRIPCWFEARRHRRCRYAHAISISECFILDDRKSIPRATRPPSGFCRQCFAQHSLVEITLGHAGRNHISSSCVPYRGHRSATLQKLWSWFGAILPDHLETQPCGDSHITVLERCRNSFCNRFRRRDWQNLVLMGG